MNQEAQALAEERDEVLRQLDDRTNQTWVWKRQRWAALVRRQAAAIDRLAAMAQPQWQPIETAQMETNALLYAPPEQLFAQPNGKLGQWFVAKPRNWTWATHWTPLPAAPKPEKKP